MQERNRIIGLLGAEDGTRGPTGVINSGNSDVGDRITTISHTYVQGASRWRSQHGKAKPGVVMLAWP